MKNLKNATLAIIQILCLLSCGNAIARNDEKKAVTELDAETFKSKVYDTTKENPEYQGSKPAIVDFTATWCGPCQRLAPILEELAGEYKDHIVVYKVDVDKCKELAQSFGISSIPALMFIPLDDEPVMLVGLRNKERLKKEIDSILLGK